MILHLTKALTEDKSKAATQKPQKKDKKPAVSELRVYYRSVMVESEIASKQLSRHKNQNRKQQGQGTQEEIPQRLEQILSKWRKKDCTTDKGKRTYRLVQNSILERVMDWNDLVVILGKGGFPGPPSLCHDVLNRYSHGLGF
ncbi:hypothetical protein E2C01_054705 [Portunus trituberculatus]|uniref:Uncharacterized protein n=1 Tax=Portunus trituberculatus TaxID=210409 RepID=A0A5B7GKD2_PORTR|nr:hypothetical protein [Portunus trituberculatus]